MGRYSLYIGVLLCAVAAWAEDPLLVKTSGGWIRGSLATSRSGRPFLAFTGIPFAKPPVGELRFQPPEEAEPWEGIRNSTERRPVCLQYNNFIIKDKIDGVEDCLYLSVFTHKAKGRRPVLFHIHGGGFVTGSGMNVDNLKAFMDEDIVIVDIQYRLGIMGFLSFEDEDLPGNQGMKDQTMALRWVQKNIASFGGDPGAVTIVGESAGGASVYHHVLSPLSRGLFHRAIAESGASYDPWSIVPAGLARTNARRLARMLSCPQNSTQEAVACLRKLDGREIVKHLSQFSVGILNTNYLMVFQPVMEPPSPGAFLTGPMSQWKSSEVPIMMGITSAEGLLMTINFVDVDFKLINDNFLKVAPVTFLYYATASDPDEVSTKIKDFYFTGEEIGTTFGDWVNLTNAYTDGLFAYGSMETADKHSGNVYFYYFDYIGKDNPWGINNTLIFGAPHTDECRYLWWSNSMSGQDLELSKELVKIWAGFAKTGIATPPDERAAWRTWAANSHNYLHITNSGFTAEEGLLEDRYSFWKDLGFRDEGNLF